MGRGACTSGPALPIAHLVSGLLLREAHRGLTFVERCLPGLVGDVGLGPGLQQGLEAVQVSPAGRQVEGRFLLQGALVDGGRVCWGGQAVRSSKRKMPASPLCPLTPNTELVRASSQFQGQTSVASAYSDHPACLRHLGPGLSSFHRAVSASWIYSSSADATSSGKPSLVEPPPPANDPVLP